MMETAADLKRLDVRPILATGGEPFEEIMHFEASLAPGEGFQLVASFRPDPLISVLRDRGYDATAQEWDSGDWCVTFRPEA